MENILLLQEHAYHLSKIINQLNEIQSADTTKWSLASDWLDLGSSIRSISIVTEGYDNTIMYCGPAIEYENEKSKTLEQFTKALSIFNFFWGALETIAKIINPPKLPKTLKKKRTIIDDCVYFLKNNYPIITSPEKYNELLDSLIEIITKDPQHSNVNFDKIFDIKYLDNTGKALALIRIIRNDFAHGTHAFPEPDDWSWNNHFKSSDYTKKINTSSRLILLTIQMLLISYFKDESIEIVKWGTNDTYVDLIEQLYGLHSITPSKCNFGLFYQCKPNSK